MSKRESVEEFLARGGKITKCEPGPTPDEELTNRVMPTPGAAATMMTLSEGSLYYSESRAKPKERKSTKKVEAINLSALPAHLLKFVPKR
jgi:hypothetical protein